MDSYPDDSASYTADGDTLSKNPLPNNTKPSTASEPTNSVTLLSSSHTFCTPTHSRGPASRLSTSMKMRPPVRRVFFSRYSCRKWRGLWGLPTLSRALKRPIRWRMVGIVNSSPRTSRGIRGMLLTSLRVLDWGRLRMGYECILRMHRS